MGAEKRGTKGTRGNKPVVATFNEEKARLNLRTKADLLKRLVEVGQTAAADISAFYVERELIAQKLVPSSLRQFNAWKSSDLPKAMRQRAPAFGTNANITLHRHPELRAQCCESLAALKGILSDNGKAVTRSTSLSRRLSLAQTLRRIAESELASALVKINELRETVSTLSSRIYALEREAGTAIEERDAEIGRLRKQNSDLTVLARKVTGIRSHHGG